MDTSKKKILIVDDEIPILDGLADKFEKEGFGVQKAKDGREGLLGAVNEHPDLILLDSRMPNMDGIEMLQKLRGDDWGKNALVVMLSNSEKQDTKEKAAQLGVIDYWLKSDVSFKEIVNRSKEILAAK